jgi:methylenetetrahydrofolate dehydrogenase (NADP+)/methenyltetrahydrofolate cyclohydrolase
MILIDGKATSEQIKLEIAEEVRKRKENGLKSPHLAAVIVGSNGASLTYVNSKVKSCAQVGFNSTLIELPEDITQEQLVHEIELLNRDSDIDGFIVQLPLPKHIDEQEIIMAINPAKDVDGFHPVNVGKMTLDLPALLPATPYGILELLERYHIDTVGKNIVVIGRSHIVGRPMSILLSQKRNFGDATVTLTHSKTENLKEYTLQADLIIAALGKAEFLTGDMVKEGVVIIDVGITRIPDASKKQGFRLAGDVHFESVSKKASYITPVPGGVGPMTIAMLLKNTLKVCRR